MARKYFVSANWKMNMTSAQTVSYLGRLIENLRDLKLKSNVVVCPPFTALRSASTYLDYEKDIDIELGAQNIYWEEKGAFTGEISPIMLKEFNIDWVIVGHSERRRLFGETDKEVKKKIRTAVEHGINPIICVGENIDEREEDETYRVVGGQVNAALEALSNVDYKDFVFAYEPIWAIGTGKAASSEDANDVTRHIRALIGSKLSPEISKEIRVIYGGSVNADNFEGFISEPDIDGALVGSASLSPKKFAELVKIAERQRG